MSDEMELEFGIQQPELSPETAADEDDFEEITSDEVDRVVESLEQLLETVQSENIRAYLEEAMNNVYFLVYEEDDEEMEDDMLPDAA